MLNVLLSVLFATRGIQNRKLFCLFLFYLFPYCVLSFLNVLRVLCIAKNLYAILQVTSAFVISLHCYLIYLVISSLFCQIVLLQSKIQTQILQLHMAKMV